VLSQLARSVGLFSSAIEMRDEQVIL